jgi:hypothetical protein
MKLVPTLDHFVRGITHGAHAVASSIPSLIGGILRLNLIVVFVIYTVAFAREFWNPLGLGLIGVSFGLSAVLALCIFGRTCVTKWSTNEPAADLGSIWACAAPAAIAIFATVIIGLWEPARFQFHDPLLWETTNQTWRFVYWITHP